MLSPRLRMTLPLLVLCATALAPAYAETPAALGERLVTEVTPKVATANINARLPQMQTAGRCTEAEALGVLGAGYVVVKQVEPALYCFARGVVLEPTNTQALNNAGFVLLDQGRLDDAAVMLEAAYALAPGNAEICMNLGKLAWRKGDKNRALQLLAVAAKDETHPAYAYSLAKAQFYSGQKAQARATLEGNLGRFPTHQPSLDLYQKATGQSYKSEGVKAMIREAVALGEEVQGEIAEMGCELDRIASACGDTSRPGSRWAEGPMQKGFSEIFVKQARDALAANPTTHDIIAINALGSYGSQLRLLSTCYHQFRPALHLWQHGVPRPGLKIEWSGTYSFSDDSQPLSETWRRYKAAQLANRGPGISGELLAAARAYLDTMPTGLDATAATYNQALHEMFRADAVLWSRWADFAKRHGDQLKSDFTKNILDSQRKINHDFFDPSANSGCRQGIIWAQAIWKHFLQFHQQELRSAAELLKTRAPEVRAPLTAEEILRAWAEAAAEQGVTLSLKFNMEIVQISLSSDGSATVQVGQGVMASGSYNFFHDNWTGKVGVGFSAANPGPVGAEFGTSATFNYDSVQGFGCEAGVTAQAGLYEAGYSKSVYFASAL